MGFFRDAALLLPLTRVRFNNAICQFVYKATNPVIGPVSQVVPALRQFSLATLLVMWLILLVEIVLMFLIRGVPLRVDYLLLASSVGLAHLLFGIGFWVVLFSAITSFFSPNPRNPAVEVLFSLAEPLLRPFRNFPPRNLPVSLAPLYATLALRLILLALQHLLGPLYAFVLPL